jgi:hypothetical protein
MHGAQLRLVLSLLGVLKCCARRRLTLRRGLLLTGTLYGIAVRYTQVQYLCIADSSKFCELARPCTARERETLVASMSV